MHLAENYHMVPVVVILKGRILWVSLRFVLLMSGSKMQTPAEVVERYSKTIRAVLERLMPKESGKE
ncbi:MAG: hypothetical protein A3H42_05750 [Deltaproteobacteria bacterium RIFCSPLOWO2_02_FULL_46_8]|nr:MAG: hypothetical protein A3H42_05750 [Deltaproteobacteria bacterium RIFCSPLOWO2_02_FULL_46_8]